ncbi:MAG: hypothetical protein KatS3mg027_0731 [Bacteroidia bacterium]|nr:MAG: hypothetical protein KatS3mg027_0731 [Bacteroidia bacterium]
MKDYIEIQVRPLNSIEDLRKNAFLILTDIHITPPHCSLLLNNQWYSLNFNECKNGIPAEILLKLIQTKNQPTIFLQLTFIPNEKITSIIFNQYSKVDFQNNITCISPIKEILVAHDIQISKNTLLYEMIELLYKIQLIKEGYSLFYTEKNFCLKTYSKEDLMRIKI